MARSERCCGTCKWGEFQMTGHVPPRPKDKAGKCNWPIPDLPLPISISVTAAPLSQLINKHSVWPFDEICQTWAPKEPTNAKR